MNPNQLTTALQLVIAFCTVIGLVYGFAIWLWPKLCVIGSRTAEFFRSIERIPAALDAIASIESIDQRLTLITKQVMPNGGSSMPDSMKRIEAKLQDNASKAEAIGKTVNLMAATMRATSNTNPRMATFEAAPDGRLVDANKTYLRWTGLTLPELTGWGWINSVHPDDREQVRREWVQAIADVRTSVMKYRIIDEDGESFRIEVTATPIPEGVTPCEKWVGVAYRDDGSYQ